MNKKIKKEHLKVVSIVVTVTIVAFAIWFALADFGAPSNAGINNSTIKTNLVNKNTNSK